MNFLMSSLLVVTLAPSIRAERSWQLGPSGGVLHLSGSDTEGLPFIRPWVGMEARWLFKGGHGLHLVGGFTNIQGARNQRFWIEDGYRYEVELDAQTRLGIGFAGAEYHHYVSGGLGKGIHPLIGVGVVYLSRERSLERHFDMNTPTESERIWPQVCIGLGFDINRHLSLALRLRTYRETKSNNRVDPRQATFMEDSQTCHLLTLGVSWFF